MARRLKRLRNRPVVLTILSFALAAVAVIAIAAAYGFGAFADAWSDLHPGWILLTIGGALLGIPAYVLSYRVLARAEDGPELSFPLVVRLVIAGFGPFRPGGGFALDKAALHALVGDPGFATVRVLGLGALEWALLAPIACITAIVLLVTGDSRVMQSLLWPWALAVPIGFAVGLWLAVPERAERISAGEGWWRSALRHALRGIAILPTLARGFPRCWLAWLGSALYWVFEIAAFYGALRFIGLRASVGETILAYATGYALTRRTMPLGGAGVTEALMTFSLHWVGQPVAPALAVVVVYRVFNFLLPVVPAFVVRRRITPLVSAADEDRAAARGERQVASAPLLRR